MFSFVFLIICEKGVQPFLQLAFTSGYRQVTYTLTSTEQSTPYRRELSVCLSPMCECLAVSEVKRTRAKSSISIIICSFQVVRTETLFRFVDCAAHLVAAFLMHNLRDGTLPRVCSLLRSFRFLSVFRPPFLIVTTCPQKGLCANLDKIYKIPRRQHKKVDIQRNVDDVKSHCAISHVLVRPNALFCGRWIPVHQLPPFPSPAEAENLPGT